MPLGLGRGAIGAMVGGEKVTFQNGRGDVEGRGKEPDKIMLIDVNSLERGRGNGRVGVHRVARGGLRGG